MAIEKKQIKQDILLAQGVRLLMQQGYHGTGLKEILDAVQIPKGSFYHYFPSKESFAAEVIQHYIQPFLDQLQRHLDTPNTSALAGLRSYYDELIEELEAAQFKGGCLLGNLMGEIGDTSDLCQQSLRLAVHKYQSLLSKALQTAQSQGEVRNDKSTDEMADLLLNTWQGALLRMKIEQSSRPLRQCCQNLLEDYFVK